MSESETTVTLGDEFGPHILLSAEDAQRFALAYIDQGWAVTAGPGLDIDGVCSCNLGVDCRNPGKHAMPGWGNDTRLTASREQAEKHWSPDNPLWATRPVDQVFVVPYLSGLIVADVDVQETWDMLPGEGYDTPETLYQSSGSSRGGHYVYKFKWDTKEPTPPSVMGKLPRGAGEIKFRGIIAAAPSVHKSGGRYTWMNPGAPIVDAPEWMTKKREIDKYSTHSWDSLMASDKTERWPNLLFTDAQNDLSSFKDATTGRPLVMFAIAAGMAKWVASGWMTREFVIEKLLEGAEVNGAMEVYGSVELTRQINNGIEAGMTEKRF